MARDCGTSPFEGGGRRRLREGILHWQPHARRLRAGHDHHCHLWLGELVCGRPRPGVANRLWLGVYGGRAGNDAVFALWHHGQEDGARVAQARCGYGDRRDSRPFPQQCVGECCSSDYRAVLCGNHGCPVRGRREVVRSRDGLFVFCWPGHLRRCRDYFHDGGRLPRRCRDRCVVRHRDARGHCGARGWHSYCGWRLGKHHGHHSHEPSADARATFGWHYARVAVLYAVAARGHFHVCAAPIGGAMHGLQRHEEPARRDDRRHHHYRRHDDRRYHARRAFRGRAYGGLGIVRRERRQYYSAYHCGNPAVMACRRGDRRSCCRIHFYGVFAAHRFVLGYYQRLVAALCIR